MPGDTELQLVDAVDRLRQHLVEEVGGLALTVQEQGRELRALLNAAGQTIATAGDYGTVRRQVWAGRVYVLLLQGAMPALLSETLSEAVEMGVQRVARRTWELVDALEAAEKVRMVVPGEGADAAPDEPADFGSAPKGIVDEGGAT